MAEFTPNPRVQRAFNRALIVLFLAAIWAPLLSMLIRGTPQSDVETTENRARVSAPTLAWNWKSLRMFPDRFEAYADNQFGFRDTLIRLHARLCVSVYSISPSPKVRLGRENWLYFDGDASGDDGSPIEDYTGLNPLPPAQLEALRYLYQDQSDYLREQGMRYLLVLVPTKPLIYPEHLPANVSRAHDTSWRDQLTAYLREHTDVDVLDLAPTLLAARSTDGLYFRTDTHWNPIGGFIGATEIIRRLHTWFPQLQPKPESMYIRTPGVAKHGDLARMMNLQDRFQETYVDLAPGPDLHGTNRVLSDQEFSPIVGGNGDPTAPTAHIYRDSFTEYLYPFLSEYFHDVTYEWGQKGTRMTGIETARPDVVLQISCDRILNSSLFYAPRFQEYGSRLRFERARPVSRFSPTEGFDGLAGSRQVRLETMPDGLAVFAPRGGGSLSIPLEIEADSEVPILRLEIRPEKPGPMTLTSPRRPVFRGQRPPEVGLGRFRLEHGRNLIHVTLTDPGIRDHVTLHFDDEPGGNLVHSIELRALPRQATPP